VALSSDGRLAASTGRDYTVRIWTTADGKEIRLLDLPKRGIPGSVAFSPDSRQLMVGSADFLRLFDVETGKLEGLFTGHTNAVQAIAFSPDGRHLLSASNDNTVRYWDVARRRQAYKFDAHTRPVLCVAFAPSGVQAITGGDDDVVRLWQLPQDP
jgi:WD40 repeat protein